MGVRAENIEIIVIGGSAGCLDFILDLIPRIPKEFPVPIVIVIHRNVHSNGILEGILQSKSKVCVKEAEMNEPIEVGKVYLATPDYHLLIEEDRKFCLDPSERENHSRPNINLTFQFAAKVYGSRTLCVLLSGANEDGALGIKKILGKGGTALVQDPGEAEVRVMPQAAIRIAGAKNIMKSSEIRDYLLKKVMAH